MRHTALSLLLMPTLVLAQPQISNSGFETWTGLGGATEEPSEWSSIKTSDGGSLINQLAPQVCWQDADAHTGSYSVRLETVSAIIGAANGIITTGRVHAELTPENGYVFTDQGNTQWNQAMTSRPDSMIGWYKAMPNAGDHGKVEIILHTGAGSIPENGTFGNWVGRARWEPASATVTTWTRFSVPFFYYNSNTPQWALAALTAGDSLVSTVGTKAWYDDIGLIYNINAVPSTNVAMVTGGMGFNFTIDWSTGGAPLFASNFTAELSDASGSFASPTTIGVQNTANASGTINCTIPAGTPAGTGYKVRVRNASSFYAPVPVNMTISSDQVLVSAKLFLDGPYDNGSQTMTDQLRAGGLI
ncbi:MAG: hypothetical protein KDB88_03895, partial [Flavobacteriales bacterium]|nr:hypothetical protein [Flavobacteriales bacterium]